jgi:hypothetical protein
MRDQPGPAAPQGRRAGVRLATLSARQHGVLSAAQLYELDFTKQAVHRWTRAGHLHRLYRGVYAVGHPRITRMGLYLAAVLACGEGAALSHRAAADLHELRPYSGRPEVTVPRSRQGPRGLLVHRSWMPLSPDLTLVSGIPVTSVARTLFDLATRRCRRGGEHGRGHRPPLAGRGCRCAGRGRPLNVNEGLEQRFAALVDGSSLARPGYNAHVEGETMSHHEWHRTRRDLRRDAAKQADLELAGYRVVRLTWDDVVTRASGTLRRLKAFQPTAR